LSEQKQILQGSKIMAAMTSLSRLFGLARDVLIASLLGATKWGDIWSISFMIPNLFRRLIAEGAMSSAFVPLLSELKEEAREEAAAELTRAIFSLILIVAVLITTVMVLAMPALLPFLFRLLRPASAEPGTAAFEEMVLPTQLMFPYLVFVSLAAICQGVLNVSNRFALSAATPILLNLAIIGCGWFLRDLGETPLWGFCIGVLLGGFLAVKLL